MDVLLRKKKKKFFLDQQLFFSGTKKFCLRNNFCSVFYVLESKKKILFHISQKDIHTAFSFLFCSVLLLCYHHIKAKLGMYFAPSIFKWCDICALELLHKDNMSCLIYFLHYSLFSTYIYQNQIIKEYLYVKKG